MGIPTIKRLIERRLGVRITDIKKPDNAGCDHWVYFLRAGNRELVLKVPKRQRYARRRLLTEDFAFRRWHRMGLPVPKIVHTDPRNDFILESRIEGRQLRGERLNRRAWGRILHQIGRSLRAMHSVKTRGYGFFERTMGTGHLKKWTDYVDREFKNKIRIIKGNKRADMGFIARIEGIWKDGRRLIEGYNDPRLIHQDLYMDNIMVSDGRLSGILDGADAVSGDPMYDIATLYMQKYLNGLDMSALIGGYGKVDMDRIKFYCIGLLIRREDGGRMPAKTMRALRRLLAECDFSGL